MVGFCLLFLFDFTRSVLVSVSGLLTGYNGWILTAGEFISSGRRTVDSPANVYNDKNYAFGC